MFPRDLRLGGLGQMRRSFYGKQPLLCRSLFALPTEQAGNRPGNLGTGDEALVKEVCGELVCRIFFLQGRREQVDGFHGLMHLLSRKIVE
jgi:hypothetical protein